jgi:hypothetical protein
VRVGPGGGHVQQGDGSSEDDDGAEEAE